MVKSLSESATRNICKLVDNATSNPHKIPGCVVVVVGKDGNPLFTHASGKRGVETQEPMSMDTVFCKQFSRSAMIVTNVVLCRDRKLHQIDRSYSSHAIGGTGQASTR